MGRFRKLGLLLYLTKLKKRARGQDVRSALNIKCPTRFCLAELKRATDDFSDTNVIGSGEYGKVYKAMLDGGQMVAMRRAEQGSMRWKARFTSEIELLSRFHHNNVLDLIGFCIDNGEQILVYDYIANGSLNDILLGIPCKYISPAHRLGKYAKAVYRPGCLDVACNDSALIPAAVKAAKEADATILVVGLDLIREAESHDRQILLLPGYQMELVTSVASASKGPVIMVIMSGGGVSIQRRILI